jgi:hypothetical protein
MIDGRFAAPSQSMQRNRMVSITLSLIPPRALVSSLPPSEILSSQLKHLHQCPTTNIDCANCDFSSISVRMIVSRDKDAKTRNHSFGVTRIEVVISMPHSITECTTFT